MESLFENYQLLSNSGLFDAEYYLAENPDVARLKTDPLIHYLERGAQELRDPHALFDAKFYMELCRQRGEQPDNPLLHFIRFGAKHGLKPWRQPAKSSKAGIPEDKSSEPPSFVLEVEEVRVAAAGEGEPQLIGEGWLVALHPIAELTVSVQGFVTRATHGLPRADVAKKFPAYPKSGQSGFTFAIALSDLSVGGDDLNDITIAAKAATGEEYEQAFRADIEWETNGRESSSMAAVRTPPTKSVSIDRPPMLLHIDSASLDESAILHIVGWAACFVPVTTVEVFVEDERIGAADYGKLRDDVALVHPEYPNARNSGFVFDAAIAHIGTGQKSIRVQATASSGISREIRLPVHILTAAKPPPHEKVVTHCDIVELFSNGRVAVSGWTICPAPTEAIHVLLDGAEIGTAELNIERPDVGNHFPALPHARRAGFRFRAQAASVAEGEHLIVLQVLSDGKLSEIKLPVLARPAPDEPVQQAVGGDGLLLSIDIPKLLGGAAASPVRSNFEIVGWALAKAGVASVDILIDGIPLMAAYYGVRRPDVQMAFPAWENAIGAGFSALVPHRSLPKGRHTVYVRLRDKDGRSLQNEFRVEIEEAPETTGPWSLRRKISPAEVNLSLEILKRQDWRPIFSLILSMADDDEEIQRVRRTLASLGNQAYEDWRVLIASSASGGARKMLKDRLVEGIEHLSPQIEIIAKSATSSGFPFVPVRDRPTFIAVARPGDEFGCDEVLEFAVRSALNQKADFLYADERRINPVGGALEAYFKPQWSPDLLLSTNYIGAAWCARSELVASVASDIRELLGAGMYDLVLRLTERAHLIHHVPTVLCQRFNRHIDTEEERRTALERALVRRGIEGEVQSGCAPGIYRVKRAVATTGLVSIIIPTCAAGGLIKTCIETLRQKTSYPNFEIVCIENIPKHETKWKQWLKKNADTVVSTTEPFNWSRFNNLAAAAAMGEFYLFLNDDIEIIDPDWLHALMEHALRPEVGVVGARLLYPDRRVQHAGMFLAGTGIARHAFRYAAEDDACYFGLALTQRNVLAVTGACMLTRRETFESLGGFDVAHSVVNNDLDYCLRAWQSGLFNVFTPHATLIHRELASRAGMKDEYNAAAFEGRWRTLFVTGDPFFHPRLSKERDDFMCEWEPVETRCAGHPLMPRGKLHNILVVKLDHIGDCVISLPAVRRLKRHFPDARLFVLSGRGSLAVWSRESSVEEAIEFDFFHMRSGLGLIERSDDDWRHLEQRLAAYHFDLAIDLRKHPETRLVLQHVGARYTAGFDHHNQFPWLDVALEWPGDPPYFHKRQHVGDDLVNLVDTVATACETERAIFARKPGGLPVIEDGDRLFSKPVVCVHPAAGTEMRQWPPEYFSILIDQLVAEEDVHIALIGGPDEAELASGILEKVNHAGSVWSLIGKIKLAELPAVLSACTLFVGNNSGPHHIAAGLGVPTIGIHSGVTDTNEWGPMGPLAVAMTRDMSCAPCYLTKMEECGRGFACLRQLLPGDVYRACKRFLALRAAPPPRAPRVKKPQRKKRNAAMILAKRGDSVAIPPAE